MLNSPWGNKERDFFSLPFLRAFNTLENLQLPSVFSCREEIFNYISLRFWAQFQNMILDAKFVVFHVFTWFKYYKQVMIIIDLYLQTFSLFYMLKRSFVSHNITTTFYKLEGRYHTPFQKLILETKKNLTRIM